MSELTRTLAREMPETERDRTALQARPAQAAGQGARIFRPTGGTASAAVMCPGRSWQALAHTMIALLPPLTVADLGAGRRNALATARQDRAQSDRGR